MNAPRLMLTLAVFALTACKNLAPDPEVAARIVEPTEASRAALQAAVNRELGMNVLLAADALTTSSLLIVEHSPPRRMDNPAAGRTMYPPIQFRLVTNGSDCILVDTRDESRSVLADTSCIAE